MLRRIMRNKVLLIMAVIALLVSMVSPDAFAWGGGGRGGRGGYYYHGGRYHYGSGWWWFGPALTTLAVGAVLDSLPRGYTTVAVGGVPYYYYDNLYYRPGPGGYVVVQPPVGAVVPTIPQNYPSVVVDGVTYYNINGATYVAAPNGYQVVPQPRTVVVNNAAPAPAVAPAQAVPTSPVASPEGSFTVNVPNSQGGYTPVMLKKSGTGYVGPQGEFYTEFPRIEQLKAMYGK